MPRAKKPKAKRKPRAAKKPHGGRRAGAGRKRDRLPKAVIDRLGACPSKPHEIRVWNARLLAEVQILSMKGEIGVDLAASLRANAGAIERALPPAPRPRDLDDDEEDDEERPGPELENIGAPQPARVEH